MIRHYKILAVGVNQGPCNRLHPLAYAEKNAADTAEYCRILKNADVTLLTGREATKSAILHWMDKVNREPGIPRQEKLKKETIVVLFFSGHVTAREWERCLQLYNEAGYHPEPPYLKMSEILKILDNPFQRLIVIIDACYHLEGKPLQESVFEAFEKSERITNLKPYAIISSSAQERHLFEDPVLRRGVLTHYLLKTLAGKYTFFLKRKIVFFKFLQILEKKVKNHRFSTTTGRKRALPGLMKNGVMAHFSDKNFKLPILEPIPLPKATNASGGQKPFREKVSGLPKAFNNATYKKFWEVSEPFFKRILTNYRKILVHFFTCTRIRAKVSLTAVILGILALLLYLAANSMVRIQCNSPQQAIFQRTLLDRQRFSLDKLGTRQVGKDRYQKVNFYFFKHNWVNAFLAKLDGTGKIILLGNLLGYRLNKFDDRQLLGYALENSHDIFYWEPEDVMSLLRTIRYAYRDFNGSQKQKALEMLAKLGKDGLHTAKWAITFTKETHQYLRNLFLQHFYTPDFARENPDFFNIDDYFYLLRNKKAIPPNVDLRLRRETEIYLQTVADTIPDTPIDITDKTVLLKMYKKLGILALWGSRHFRKKAPVIFNRAFDPDEVFGLFLDSIDLQDKLWLLELYMRRVRHIDNPFLVWDQLVYRYIPQASPEEKGSILATIMNTNLELVPKKYWNMLLNYLRYIDPRIIPLADWEKWMQRYTLEPRSLFYWLIDKDYPEVFSFLERHYDYFKNLFNGGILDRLYEFDRTKTLRLVRELFETGTIKDRLQAAVFLYNKDHPKYTGFILDFLEKAGQDIHHQQILQDFYGPINETIIKLTGNHKNLRERLKRVSFHPALFYRFSHANLQLWPNETILQFFRSEIPRGYLDGYPFLKKCEQLPGRFRKEMLLKIINADIEPLFRSRVEAALTKYYPRELLEIVFDSNYNWNRDTGRNIVKAYQEFAYKTLKEELIKTLKKKSYGKVGFICEALKGRKEEEAKTRDIQYTLTEFDRPLQRIVLRELRYYLHQRQFLEVK